MVLTPPKPGEPPFTLAKVTPTPKGKSIKQITRLDTARHALLKGACLKVADLYATSDIFRVAKDNFDELCELLRKIARHRPPPPTDSARRPIFREVINTVSAFRMFSDHLDREAKSNFGDEVAGELKQALSREYDASLSYRLCYQLRNHATHAGFPSLNVQVRSSMRADSRIASESHDDGRGVFAAVLVSIDRDELLRDKKLKASVRDEVKNLEENFELVEHLRSAVEALERVHEFYEQKRQIALKIELQLLDEVIVGETIEEGEWFYLFEPPKQMGEEGSNAFRISYTRFPMVALRTFWQARKAEI